jgi:Major Facilitator Superfamily
VRPRAATARRLLPYAAVVLAVGFDAASYAILAPVLPALRERARLSGLLASAVFAGLPFGLAVGQLLVGLAIVRIGCRRTILAGLAGHLMGDMVLLLATSPVLVAASRVAQGLASGCVFLGAVFLVLQERVNIGVRLGGLLSAGWIGTVIGPAMATAGGAVRPFAVHLATGALVVAAGLAWLPQDSAPLSWGRVRTLRDPRVILTAVGVSFAGVVDGVVLGSFPLRFSVRLSQPALSALYTTASLSAGLAALAAGFARTPRGAANVIRVGIVLAGGLVLLLSWTTWPMAWFPLLAGITVTLSAAETAALRLMAGLRRSGVVVGMLAFSQSWAIGTMVGPVLGTWSAGALGPLAPGVIVFGCSLLLAALAQWVIPPACGEAQGDCW